LLNLGHASEVIHLHPIDPTDSDNQDQVEGNVERVGGDADEATASSAAKPSAAEDARSKNWPRTFTRIHRNNHQGNREDRRSFCQSPGLALAIQISLMAW
jgi:hypothetical protein